MDELKKILEDKYNPIREVPVYIKGDKGDKGDTPVVDYDFIIDTVSEKIPECVDYDLINQRVLDEIVLPEPVHGKDYVITEKDKQDIALLVDIPVVEKVIEKIETVVTKEVESSETGVSIVEKINELSVDDELLKIDASHIKNLPKGMQQFGGGGVRKISLLNDVKLTNLTNNQILQYNSITKLWENVNNSGGGGGGGVWGSITGTLSDQTDLQSYLDGKLSTALTVSKILVGDGSNIATVVALSGDATLANTGALTIANNAITFAKVQNIATDRLLGRDTTGTGNVEELTVGGGIEFTGSGGIQTSAFTGDVTKTAGGTALTIANNAVTDAKFRQSSGLSVVGRSANSTGNVADITAANDGEVLRRSGTSIGFGTVATAGIANSAITYAKIQDVSAQYKVLGRKSSGAGAVEEIDIDTDITSVSASDDTVPSAKATKTYVDAQPKAMFAINYTADVAAAGVTRYLALCSAGLPDSGTENQRDFPVAFSGTAKNFYFITTTAQSGTGSLVLTIRKNASDTSIVITIAAGSAAGTFSDTSNTASFTAGDTLNVKVINNASTNSASYNGASLAFY